MSQNYQGFYARFETFSKKDSGTLEGADTLIGDEFRFEFVSEDGVGRIVLKNKFDAQVGYFDENDSHKIRLLQAREWKIHILMSLLAYSSEPAPGHYWGEMCVIAYHPSLEEPMGVFVDGIKEMLGQGLRPQIDLNESAVDTIVKQNGDWKPNDRVPLPEKKENMAIIKSKRSVSEKLVEEGRKGKIGCYIVSYAFIVVIVALIVLILHLIGLF